MQKIDLAVWPRAELFRFFSTVSDPFYSVTFRVDVTNLHAYTKAHSISFYYALCYLATDAVNAVENFRYTIRDGEVFLLDGRIPSFTDLKPDSEQFHIVTLPKTGTLDGFCHAAKAKSDAQQSFLDQSGELDDLIYFSCVPWFDLTEVIAKSLVDHPSEVVVTETVSGDDLLLELKVDPSDMGKVIGRQGRIAKAIRTVVKAASSKSDRKVVVEILQ